LKTIEAFPDSGKKNLRSNHKLRFQRRRGIYRHYRTAPKTCAVRACCALALPFCAHTVLQAVELAGLRIGRGYKYAI